MSILVPQRNQRFLPTPYPPYLFSLITSSFQVAAWAMKFTSTHKLQPRSAWDPHRIHGKDWAQVNLPYWRWIQATQFGSRPPQMPESSTSVARLCSHYAVAGYSICHPVQPFDVQSSCPTNNMLFLKCDETHLNQVCKWKIDIQKPA